MQDEANVVECEPKEPNGNLDAKKKAKKEGMEQSAVESGELRFYGARGMVMNPLSMCEKIDKMFGSGAEAIVHYMWFESGLDTFDTMLKSNQDKSAEELLRALIDLQPQTGWGHVSLKVLRIDPPLVEIVVKNSPVKTLKGSQKQTVSSFWAGVLSRYFNRQLTCKNFCYYAERDELSCTVAV